MQSLERKSASIAFYDERSYTTEASIGFLLGRCVTCISDAIDRSLADLGLRSQQFGVLHAILKGRAITPSDLGRLRFQNSAAIAYTLDVLEARKLLIRMPRVQDRRGIELRLTPEGRALTKLSISRVVEAQNTALKGLNRAEFDTLGTLLQRICGTEKQ